MIINEDVNDIPSAAEDAAIAMTESMATQTVKAAGKSQQAPFRYIDKCIALLKRSGIRTKRLKDKKTKG
jgi:hypothetical protein